MRVLDLSGLATNDLTVSTTEGIGGLHEVGSYRFPNSDTWSAKTNKIARDGSFYLFGNDVIRGFDVYKYTPAAVANASALTAGTWRAPSLMPLVDRLDGYRPSCLIPR